MSHPVARAVEYAKRVSITSPLSIDTPLYKFMPIGRLPQLARDGQLVLVRPEVWDDPQEPLSTVMKIQAIGHTGQYRSEIVQEYPFQAFAMSWTKAEMRDTMLRAYSTLRDLPEQSEDNVPAFDLRLDRGEGVHISTTVGQLNSALNEGLMDRPGFVEAYIAVVKYQSLEDNARSAYAALDSDPFVHRTPRYIFEPLTYKRKEFTYEDEVRVIAIFDRTADVAKMMPVPVDARRLINSVTIDPRISLPKRQERMPNAYSERAKFLTELGFDGKIRESDLYGTRILLESPIKKITEIVDPEERERWVRYFEQMPTHN